MGEEMFRFFRQLIIAGIISILAFFMCGAVSCREPQKRLHWQEELEYRPNEIFPIKIGKYGYPYVQVIINDQELEMAFDTGNMSGLLVAPEAADRLSLCSVGESQHYDSSGEVIGTFRVFKVPKLKVFDKVWIEERAHEHTGSGLIGLIGPRYVYGKRFTLDYQNEVIAVSESPLPRVERENSIFPLIQSESLKGLIVIKGLVNGEQVLIEIDTGKSRTCVDSALIKKIDLPEVEGGYRIDEIQLGPYSFKVASAKKVSFRGMSDDFAEPILFGVGSDLLSQVVLSVDYSKQIVMISKLTH
jgi:predicted aspartyl protease